MSGVRIVDREYYSFYRQFDKQMGIIIQTSYGLQLFTRAVVLQVVGGGGGRVLSIAGPSRTQGISYTRALALSICYNHVTYACDVNVEPANNSSSLVIIML